ncbi:MAG: hypothetical protein R8P61_00665 [Bacteroidia bacterium]|nr:hypothetical protein [Bacteroidia bacterium]
MLNKNIGIWLDSDKAYIFSFYQGKEELEIIYSQVEHFQVQGGYGSGTTYKPQEAVSESKYLHRKKAQLKDFYSRIKMRLKGAEAIAIYGPAEAKLGLKKSIMSCQELKDKIVAFKSSGNMTDNQKRALMRDFFQKEYLNRKLSSNSQ